MLKQPFFTTLLLRAVLVGGILTVAIAGSMRSATAGLLDVRIDFGSGYATTPTGWNEVSVSFLSTVTTSGNEQTLSDYNVPSTPTGVALKVTDAFYASTFSTASTWQNPYAPWMDANAQSALADWALVHGTADKSQLVLTGLDPGSLYTVELLGLREGVDSNAAYQVNGTAGTAIFAGAPGSGTTAGWNADDDGYVAQGFMQWLEVSPSTSGEIVIDVDRLGGTYAFLNAMRISQVPEPGALTLFVVGLVALLVRRRARTA